MTFAAGDRVVVTFADGRVVEAEVAFASPNGRSVSLSFGAGVDGHSGQMAVLLDEHGTGFVAVMSGRRGWLEPLLG